jgi:hypothetical protein
LNIISKRQLRYEERMGNSFPGLKELVELLEMGEGDDGLDGSLMGFLMVDDSEDEF